MSSICSGSFPRAEAGQSRQFHADSGDAEDVGAVVAYELARDPDQDQRRGLEPRPLHDLSDGQGRRVATDVPGNPDVADTTRASMSGAGVGSD